MIRARLIYYVKLGLFKKFNGKNVLNERKKV